MIRRSSAIALLALVLSLLAHLVGLSFTARGALERPASAPPSEEARVGTAFEDISEAVTEPVVPEEAPEPEPEPQAEPPPEPERAETPTSRALVASDNPQQVLAPDTGTAPTPRPDRTGPVTPETGDTPAPEVVTPSEGTESSVADARITPPVGTDTVTELPEGTPEAESAPPAPEPEEFAALPAPVAPTAPVQPVPVAPSEEDTLAPVPDAEAAPDAVEPGAPLTSSLRPRLPERRPSNQNAGVSGGVPGLTAPRLAPSELIESPLTAYQRDGTDVFAGRSGGRQSGGAGFSNSRGPGNSNVTNYAGQVLVHLNNAPSVAVSSRGWARVFFVINPDGTLASVDIIDGTGNTEVDRAARAHVRGAAPFPRPPEGRRRSLNFVYQIR